MTFEFFKKPNPPLKKEESNEDNKTILSHLRDNSLSHKLIKAGTAATLFLGVENGIKAENKNNDLKDTKIETVNNLKIENNNPTPESYDARHIVKDVETRLKNIDNYKESSAVLVADGIKKSNKEYSEFIINYASEKLTKILEETQTLKNKISELDSKKDSSLYQKISEELQNNQDRLEIWNKFKKEKENEIKEIKETPEFKFSQNDLNVIKNSPALINAFESAKNEIISILSSQNYLKKLAIEFNCDIKEAKLHQATRINNVRLASCEFLSRSFLFGVTSSQAYYSPTLHQISLPYDVDLKKITDLAIHELLHSATLSSKGLSVNAKHLLSEESFKSGFEYEKGENDYFSNPTERYVRIKILDIELDRLGIKKLGENMTKDQYHKMLEVYMNQISGKIKGKDGFNDNAMQFIDFTKDGDNKEGGYEIYKKLFNEIALNQGGENKEKEIYKHGAWSYGDKENSA